MIRIEDNLLLREHRWATGQDENFTTEAFAHLLRCLLRCDKAAGLEILERLTKNNIAEMRIGTDPILVVTQFPTKYGYPDIVIQSADFVVFLENKIESGVNEEQLENYRQALKEHHAEYKCLILLTRYPTAQNDASDPLPFRVHRWFRICDWLEEFDDTRIKSEEGRFYAAQFIDFLKQRCIAMQSVHSNLISGIQSMQSLLMMVEEALNGLKLKNKQSKTLRYLGFYAWEHEKKDYWIGVSFKEPGALRFETNKLKINVPLAKKNELGQVEPNPDNASDRIWINRLDFLDSGFFEFTRSRQMEEVENFIRISMTNAEKLRLQRSPSK